MPGSIYDYLIQQLVPGSIHEDYQRMLGLQQSDPQAFLQALKQPPKGDVTSAMANVMPIAGMAKTFTKGPTTLEELIDHLVKNETTLPSRKGMLPSIQLPKTGEIFKGDLGGLHPHEAAVQTMTRRGQPAGGMIFGYTPTYEGAPFVHETLANALSQQGGPKRIQSLLNQGIKPQTIVDILQQGRVF